MNKSVSLHTRATPCHSICAYNSQDRESYLDLQEFVEDTLFSFVEDASDIDFEDLDALLPIAMERQSTPQSLITTRLLIQYLKLNGISFALDLPYLYAAATGNFLAIAVDDSQSFTAIYIRRDAGTAAC